MSFFGATGTPVLNFWWCLLWVSKPEWVLPYSLFAEANVMYIPRDAPLVLHLPTSWRPACSWSLSHMHVQRWDLARIRMGNHADRRRKRYHCASDPAKSCLQFHILTSAARSLIYSNQKNIVLHWKIRHEFQYERRAQNGYIWSKLPVYSCSTIIQNNLYSKKSRREFEYKVKIFFCSEFDGKSKDASKLFWWF